MAFTTLSSRQFNQDTCVAKKAARQGPVVITDRGRPSHVLLSFDEYQRLTGGCSRIADLLALTAAAGDAADAELVLTPQRDLAQPADLR